MKWHEEELPLTEEQVLFGVRPASAQKETAQRLAPFQSSRSGDAVKATSVDTVQSLLARVSDDEILTAVERLYEENYGDDYRDALKSIRSLEAKREDAMCVLISDGDEWNRSQGFAIDVYGRELGDQTLWSLSCTSWKAWLAMPVIIETASPLPDIEAAAHILYEMTWGGWSEEDVNEKREMISGRMDDLREAIEAGDTSDFVTINLPKPN